MSRYASIADPTRLSQVFSNLLNNAANYTEPGGHIDVRATPTTAEVTVDRDRQRHRHRAGNAGPGVPDVRAGGRIAERVHGGLGVGLTLARHLIELHGGSIEARSAGIGQGSEFIVRLPRARSMRRRSPLPARRRRDGRSATRRILIADDNVDFATSLEVDPEGVWATTYASRTTASPRLDVAAAVRAADRVSRHRPAGPQRLRRRAQPRASRQTATCQLVAVTGWGQDDDRPPLARSRIRDRISSSPSSRSRSSTSSTQARRPRNRLIPYSAVDSVWHAPCERTTTMAYIEASGGATDGH